MFGLNAPRVNYRPTIRDDGHAAGMNRDGHGVNPLAGGVVGLMAQHLINRHVVSRATRRFGGLGGMLVGMGATYAVNRLLHGKRRRPWGV